MKLSIMNEDEYTDLDTYDEFDEDEADSIFFIKQVWSPDGQNSVFHATITNQANTDVLSAIGVVKRGQFKGYTTITSHSDEWTDDNIIEMLNYYDKEITKQQNHEYDTCHPGTYIIDQINNDAVYSTELTNENGIIFQDGPTYKHMLQ